MRRDPPNERSSAAGPAAGREVAPEGPPGAAAAGLGPLPRAGERLERLERVGGAGRSPAARWPRGPSASGPDREPLRPGPSGGDARTRVWDLPTRLFHWGLAGSVGVALLSGPDPGWGAAHVTAGWVAGGLLGFRLVWGLVGERWSRWSALGRDPGHDRLASASIVAALVAVGVLTVSGVVVLGGEEARGPLAGRVGPALGVAVHRAHGWLGWGLLAWIGVHLAGVARKSWETRQDLVRAMVDGHKRWDGAPVRVRAGAAAAMVAAVGLALGWAWHTRDRPPSGPPLASSEAWSTECGDCHLAFHPSLLPASSWEEMLVAEDHFGEVLGLDPATTTRLRWFAADNAADRGQTEHAVRIAAEGGAPQHIVDTRLWQQTHAGLASEVFDREEVGGRLRCGACHPDAEDGTFDGRAADVPAAKATPARQAGRTR